LFLVPQFYELLHSPRAERLDKVPLIRLRSSMLARHKWRVKRVFDVLVASCGIVLTAPIMAAVALVIRLESGPGVLFRQQRVGKDGDLFTLLKFRSMRPATALESAERWSISGDARVGSVGRFLRKTSLDELPQLINVLRGDMSLVGPRPERPHFVERFGQQYDSYALRHRVRPGLTGWAAINGLRGDTSIEDRAFFDNAYIDNWSLWLDVKVILRTFTAVAGARGE
jgi:exopolysaccharide biosynthesis polyprenyl glycosylphosphotransferase